MMTVCPDPDLLPYGYVPVDEVAEMLGVRLEQVERWAKEGYLASGQPGWIKLDNLRMFVEKCTWAIVADPLGYPVHPIPEPPFKRE